MYEAKKRDVKIHERRSLTAQLEDEGWETKRLSKREIIRVSRNVHPWWRRRRRRPRQHLEPHESSSVRRRIRCLRRRPFHEHPREIDKAHVLHSAESPWVEVSTLGLSCRLLIAGTMQQMALIAIPS